MFLKILIRFLPKWFTFTILRFPLKCLGYPTRPCNPIFSRLFKLYVVILRGVDSNRLNENLRTNRIKNNGLLKWNYSLGILTDIDHLLCLIVNKAMKEKNKLFSKWSLTANIKSLLEFFSYWSNIPLKIQ